jgi:DNA-binding IclR family transcriptional regulator
VEMAGDVANISVLKACKVLRAFTPTVGVLSVRQVAARAQIPRSTAHELCRTLVAEGMLESSGNGYQLGPMLLELAGQIIERTGMLRAAEGILDRLVRAPEQEAHLGRLTQGWVVYLDRNSSTRHVAMFNRVGQRAPAHLTGCGKAALTWLAFDKVVEHVERCCAESAFPLPNLEELEAELDLGRQNGYITSQSFQKDRMSVAAAILDASGHPLGGVSVAGPTGMFTSAVLASTHSSVTDAASQISARIISGLPPWPLAMR